MTLLLPSQHPAFAPLAAEGAPVVAGTGPGSRPLRIALLNLMPDKPATDRQFARLLASNGQLVEIGFFLPPGYPPGKTDPAYMAAFYRPWAEITARRFDGLIVTGAPLERLPFGAVTFWPALTEIFEWAAAEVGATLCVCWAAQAALHHAYGVEKHPLAEKLSGVYFQSVLAPEAPLLRGLEGGFLTPVSRHSEVRLAELPREAGLKVLARSLQSGLCLLEDRQRRAHYFFNHLEYEAETLLREYLRDRAAGLPVRVPANYLPGDSLARTPLATWRPFARRFFANWLRLVAERALSLTFRQGLAS